MPLKITTDVAALGLDVTDVEVVMKYTFALTIKEYMHRIEQTGRELHLLSFKQQETHGVECRVVMKLARQPIPKELKKFGSTITKKEYNMCRNFGLKYRAPITKAPRIVTTKT